MSGRSSHPLRYGKDGPPLRRNWVGGAASGSFCWAAGGKKGCLAINKLTALQQDFLQQALPEKLVINGIRIDPPEEILANKLCALLARAEIRDLVDVRALEHAGYPVEGALEAAAAKERGLKPAQLGWVLSQIELGDALSAPGGVSTKELRQYLVELVVRLARKAFPESC